MRVVEQIGKTVEEAKAEAFEKLGVKSEDEVEVEVLDEGTKGVFGWGTKYARIRVKVKEGATGELGEILDKILGFMQADAKIERVDDDGFMQVYNIYGEELGFIIGKKGQTLDALQLLVNIIANKKREEPIKIVLDVEGYRERRENFLIDLAKRTAFRVKKDRKNIALEPMIASERKIIHLALKDFTDVTTFSEGIDPMRKVVIAPNKNGAAVATPAASPTGYIKRTRPVYRERSNYIPRKNDGPLPPPVLQDDKEKDSSNSEE